MDVLISSIGSRGEVQPILALAIELRALGAKTTLCVAPNFTHWIESFGIDCIPVGPDLEKFVADSGESGPARKRKRSQWRTVIAETVRDQFAVVRQAAQGRDLVVVADGLQTAGRSVAEALGIPYVYAAYCAGTLHSADHPPPMIPWQSLPRLVNRLLWTASERSWNGLFLPAVNEQRAALGLPALASAPRHIFTKRPWLAADAALGPAPQSRELAIVQTGAWLLDQPQQLPEELEHFFASGEPPIYFGFGSMRARPDTSRTLIDAARSLGRRALVSHGWGRLGVVDDGRDCLSVGAVDHAKLFARVAAVVHHGGAGTTTTAARAGVPQVIVPHLYDQHYWAQRVELAGIGVRAPVARRLDSASLARALRSALEPSVAARAAAFAPRVETDGARIAAARLMREHG